MKSLAGIVSSVLQPDAVQSTPFGVVRGRTVHSIPLQHLGRQFHCIISNAWIFNFVRMLNGAPERWIQLRAVEG